MTTPTHTSAIPAGGILTQHVDSDWQDYVAGRPLQQRVCIAVVQPSKISAGNTQKGRSKSVGYEDVHFVEVTDAHEADRLRHLLTQLKADRGLLIKQPGLFDLTDEEQRDSLLDMIKEHASEQDIPITELDARFVDYFGGQDNASAETVQACRSVLQLKEFAFHIGAIAETKPEGESAVDDPPFSDGSDDPCDDGSEPDDEAA